MVDKKEDDILKEVKFANWNQWYTDLTNEITIIRRLGHEALFTPQKVNEYYSVIVNLYSTVLFALDKEDKVEIEKTLNTIENNLFSENYIASLGTDKTKTYQRKILKALRKILSKMCEELSEAGLLPKVERSTKDTRPGAVRDDKRKW